MMSPLQMLASEGWWPALRMTAIRLAIPILGVLLAATVAAQALDLDELTVATMGRDGSWGVATAGSQGQAIAAAIRDCQVMSTEPSDCGSQFTTTRGGWVVASLCGDHKVIVTGKTLEAAEEAARIREMDVRRSHLPGMPACRRVLIVDPDDAVAVMSPRHVGIKAD